MAYDVYSVRGLYTTLSEGWTYLWRWVLPALSVMPPL